MPLTTEVQRLLHEQRAAALREAIGPGPERSTRRRLGARLVSIGLRLAPEERVRAPVSTGHYVHGGTRGPGR